MQYLTNLEHYFAEAADGPLRVTFLLSAGLCFELQNVTEGLTIKRRRCE
jgi:hypothetical protein